MNTVVTSRAAILEASRQLIREKGWAAVNIRSVAGACGVSVGSIYNYFNSKADLMAATVESIWCDIFHFSDEDAFDSFTECIRVGVYQSGKRGTEISRIFCTSLRRFCRRRKGRRAAVNGQVLESYA